MNKKAIVGKRITDCLQRRVVRGPGYSSEPIYGVIWIEVEGGARLTFTTVETAGDYAVEATLHERRLP